VPSLRVFSLELTPSGVMFYHCSQSVGVDPFKFMCSAFITLIMLLSSVTHLFLAQFLNRSSMSQLLSRVSTQPGSFMVYILLTNFSWVLCKGVA
jgi:hypothetical protein